jgi:hypothetical protein
MEKFPGDSVVLQAAGRWTFARNKSFPLKTHFLGAQAGCGDATSLHGHVQKPSQKHHSPTSIGSRLWSPFFLCLGNPNAELEGGCDGWVAAIVFFAKWAQPSHNHQTSPSPFRS